MATTELKLVIALAIFLLGALGALIPWMRRHGRDVDHFMVWGDTFAGGVLAGAGLVHLLSSGAAGFGAWALGFTYPLAFVLAGAGFLLVLLIEAVIVADPDPSVSPLHCASGGAATEISPAIESHTRSTTSFILLMVLSVHAIILGLALGAQTTAGGALAVFIAIMAHKLMEGFALGVTYRRTGASRRHAVRAAAVFALMTPVGILAGTAIYTIISTEGRELFEAVFDSIGAGTFLYIATVDIIRTEFEIPGDNWQKWLLAAGGFAIMSLLAIWI